MKIIDDLNNFIGVVNPIILKPALIKKIISNIIFFFQKEVINFTLILNSLQYFIKIVGNIRRHRIRKYESNKFLCNLMTELNLQTDDTHVKLC